MCCPSIAEKMKLFCCAGNFFTKYDEEIATTFSVYCGISLYQVNNNIV